MSKPSHVAYVITEPKDGETKGYWREIGAVWPHKSTRTEAASML
jgi:hypothetical protein